MRRFVLLCITFATLIAGGFSKSFPDELKCAYEDGNCIHGKINEIFKKYSSGNAELGLGEIDPLDIGAISISQDAKSPVNINLTLQNTKVSGFSNAEVSIIKGFGKDIKGPHEISIKVPYAILLGDYVVDGRVLVLPIVGKGSSNITFVMPSVGFKFEGKPVERDGKTYLQIAKSKTKIDSQQVQFHFEGLFGGDKALGDNMNKFLNENWKDIIHELSVPLNNEFGKVLVKFIGKVFETFPYNELFAKN